jgi:hypothetical protein
MNLEEVKALLKQNPDHKVYEKCLLASKTNSSLYVEVVLEYVNFLTINKAYDKIVKLLEKALSERVVQEQALRLKLTEKLVTTLLKLEDFSRLLPVLKTRKSLIVKDSDILMQKFYEAVCFEGLEENKKAIEALLSIKDNISNQNLVNKYLKLSMLTLKDNDYEKAQEYYNLAVFYDKQKKNPTFLLAECDLLMYKKAYIKALAVYEDYYIKTKNKYRYLDRYIQIQIALKAYGEAYDFYLKHKPIMLKVLSKQSRIVFYEATIKLLKLLNKTDELAEIVKLQEQILYEDKDYVQFEDFIIDFIDNNYQKVFVKEREIIHSLFKAIDKSGLFSKLVMVRLDGGKLNAWHYSSGLLLEKELSAQETNVYKDIANLEYKPVYDKKDVSLFNQDKFMSPDCKYVFVNEIYDFNYFVFYLDNNEYYNARKFFELCVSLTRKLLNDFDLQKFNQSLVKNLLTWLNQDEKGILLIKDNQIRIFNAAAKELLEIDKDVISIEDFQARLVKNIYLDELLSLNDTIIKYQGSTLKKLKLNIFKEDLKLYLIIEEVKEETEKKHDFGIKDLLGKEVKNDSSLVLFNLRNYHDLIKDYSMVIYDELIQELTQTIKTSSRNYFLELYADGMDSIYLLIETKDKRILKRVVDEAKALVSNRIDMRVASINLKDIIAAEDLESLKYLVSLTKNDIWYLADSKMFRRNREVAKTIYENLKKVLAERKLKLAFKPVVVWEERTLQYLYLDLVEKSILGDKESLVRVVNANKKEIEWDDLISDILVKDTRLMNVKSRFIMDISIKTLTEKNALSKIKKRFNSKSFNNSSCYFTIDYQEYLLSMKQVENTENIYLRNLVENLLIKDINILKNFRGVIITASEIEKSDFGHLFDLIKGLNLEIIYDHGKTDLTKSFLKDNDIKLVMGEAYGKYDSLKQINKQEEK